jgi:hypothetical protein
VRQLVLKQNIQGYSAALETETDAGLLDLIKARMLADQRELALLSAAASGVRIGPPPASNLIEDSGELGAYLSQEFERTSEAWMLVDAGPGLTIVDINGAFEALSMQSRAEAVGRPLFEVFPDNPAERTADGVSNLYASLKTASETGRPHAMAVQRYDIKDVDGNWLERWWRAVNIPIFDAEMRLMYLLQQVERVERP